MTTRRIIGQDVIDQIIALRQGGAFQAKIAHDLDIGVATVNRVCQKAAREGQLGTKPVLDGFEITKITTKQDDGSYITQRPATPDGELELPEGHILERTTLKVGDSWYKTKLSAGAQTKADLIEMLSEYRGKSEIIPRPAGAFDSDLVTVYPTSDLHLGMLAWGRETGTPWDLAIARETVLGSMADLVGGAPRSKTAILVDLGDGTHTNSQSNETPRGHHQLDVDGRFPKVGKEAMRLRVDLIELALQKHEQVIYRGLPGNHDPEVAQMIAIAMALLFERNPRVTVDDDPSDFWFYEHGVVMLCANHGHRTKPEKLPGVMASYRPEMWGRTKVKQAFSGHVHHTRSGEDMSARWETLRTIAPRDAYAHQHGYSAGRELIALTYHNERGLRSRQVVEIL